MECDLALQDVFQQLCLSAQERGALRKQLLETQQALANTRAELQSWTQGEGTLTGGEERLNGSNVRSHDQKQNDVAQMLAQLSSLSQQIVADALADEAALEEG